MDRLSHGAPSPGVRPGPVTLVSDRRAGRRPRSVLPRAKGQGDTLPPAWRLPHRVRRQGPQSLRSPCSPCRGHGTDRTAPAEEGPTRHHVYGTPGRTATAPPGPWKTGQQRSLQETGRWPRCDQSRTWAPIPPFPGGFTRLGASRVRPTHRSGQGAGTPPGLQGPGGGTPPLSDVHKRGVLHAQLHPPQHPLCWHGARPSQTG